MSAEELLDEELNHDEEDESIENMYLTFMVNNELYAVGIAHVTEIVGVQNIVEVPDVPSFIKGVINLRGKVITVMDVRLRFHIPEKDYDDRTCIIVLEVDDVPTGLVVDRVNEVLEISEKDIDPPPNWKTSSKDSVIQGMGKFNEQVAVILDVNKLLYEERVSVPQSEIQQNNISDDKEMAS